MLKIKLLHWARPITNLYIRETFSVANAREVQSRRYC